MRSSLLSLLWVASFASTVIMCGGDDASSDATATPDGGGTDGSAQGPDGSGGDGSSATDGATPDAGPKGPAFGFVRTFPGSVQQGSDVRDAPPITALPGGGGYAIAFEFTGTITVGASTLVSTGARDVAIVVVDAQGNAVRGKMVAVNDDVEPRELAADGQGNLYFSGLTFSASVDFGDGKTLSGSNVAQWGFVVKYDAAGTTQWARSFSSSGGLGQMLVAARGDALFAGGYSTLSGGIVYATSGGTVASPAFMGNSEKGFVAALDPATGYVTWFEQLSCGGTGAKTWDIAALPNGDVALVGEFRGGPLTIDDPLVLGQNAGGNENVFVTKMTAAGAHAWTRTFGVAGGARATGNVLAADAAGHVVATGIFGGGIDFGGGVRTGSAWVASFDAATGTTAWDKPLPVGTPAGITLLGDGTTVISFSPVAMPAAATVDGVALPTSKAGMLVGFGGTGAVTWARGKEPQGATTYVYPGSLANDATYVVEHGTFRGTVDFGGGPVVANGDGGATQASYLLGLKP